MKKMLTKNKKQKLEELDALNIPYDPEKDTKKIKNRYSFHMVEYIKHTGFVTNCFSSYPDWLNEWIRNNYFSFQNGRLCLMHKEENEIAYEFSIGHNVVLFRTDGTVGYGEYAMMRIMCELENINYHEFTESCKIN